MKITCRRLTLKIRLFTVFSVWKTTFVQIGHRISWKIITNLQIIERIIYWDKCVTYMWIAFSRKFYSIKLQTFKFENIRFKFSAQSEWSHCPCRDNGCHEQTIGSSTPFRKTSHLLIASYEAFNEHSTMPKNQSRANFKRHNALSARDRYVNKSFSKWLIQE